MTNVIHSCWVFPWELRKFGASNMDHNFMNTKYLFNNSLTHWNAIFVQAELQLQ